MDKNILTYKGYLTKIEYSSEDGVLFGKIEGINDLILFDSENASEIEAKFQEAVDDYLAYCQEKGKEPDKNFKGQFNVRVSRELHRELYLFGVRNNQSLNSVVEEALNEFVSLNKRAEYAKDNFLYPNIFQQNLEAWTNILPNISGTISKEDCKGGIS